MHTVTIARGHEYRETYAVAARLSVRAWVNLNVGDDFSTPMICLYQGQPLMRTQWDITIIEADVVFVPLPLGGGGGGGGKNPLAIIGMVAVMVVAVVAQQYWVPGALAGTALGAGGAYAGIGTALGFLASAAIMIGGSMLINALFPTKMPKIDANIRDLESASPTYSLSASQNQARLYQMIPECFGTNDEVPDLAAQPWMEFQGNEQYLHQLLCIGVGEYQIQSVSIEDTAIWEDGAATDNFPEVEIEIVNPGQSITLFPDNIESSPEVSGQSLNKGTIGPFTANSAGTEASAIGIDVIFPSGLGRMNTDAGGSPILSHGVSVRFDFRKVDNHGKPIGEWYELFSRYYSAATRTPQRHTHIISEPQVTDNVSGVSGQDLRTGITGPFVINPAGTKAVTVMFDIRFPYGLYTRYDGYGVHTVGIRLDCRRIDANGNPTGDWGMLFSKRYSSSGWMWPQPLNYTESVNVDPDRYEVRAYCTEGNQISSDIVNNVQLVAMRCNFQMPKLSGRYQVRGVCTGGGQENAYLMNEVVWGGMKAYLPSKLVYPDITLIAVRAMATNALSQTTARQFHVVHTRKLPKWNPSTGWSVPQPTNSWAWAMAAIAKAPWGGRRTDRQIDLNALYRLDQELAARGDEFCQVLDTRQTVWGLFTEACRCVRAIPRAVLSTISWMRDAPGRRVRGVFTPYNIIRGSFSVDYAFFSDDSPDDVVVEYRDREGWVERDVRAALPESLSLEPARKRFIGITSRAQAYHEACFEAACNSYRRIFLTWSTELEGRLLFRGDMVLVTHPLGGEGHWASVTGWDEGMAALRLDTALPWEESAESYYAVLRRPNGTPYGPVVVARVDKKTMILDPRSLSSIEAAESAKENYVPVWEWLSDGSGSVATAVTYGKESQGLQAIILSVKPRQNGVCDIEAVVEDERVHQADLGPVPPWSPGGEATSVTVRPVISDLVASYAFTASLLTLSWSQAAGASSYQVQYRSYETWQELTPNDSGGSDWVTRIGWSEWNDLGESFETSRSFVVPPVTVEYRVRGLHPEISGLWVTRQADCSVGMPGRVELSLAAAYDTGNLDLQWPAVDAQEIIMVLSSSNSERMRKSIAGDATTTSITAAEMQEVGGPWRNIEVVAISQNSTWEEQSLTLTALDVPPAKITGVNVALSGPAAALLTWNVGIGGCTGYVIIHVDSLGASQTFTIEGDGTTQISIPVSVGMNQFSVAGKDALYDITPDLYALYFSDPVSLEVPV